jgi:hypothetical protein
MLIDDPAEAAARRSVMARLCATSRSMHEKNRADHKKKICEHKQSGMLKSYVRHTAIHWQARQAGRMLA